MCPGENLDCISGFWGMVIPASIGKFRIFTSPLQGTPSDGRMMAHSQNAFPIPPWHGSLWRCPKSWGYPQFSSIYRWIFNEINHPAIKGYPLFIETPIWEILIQQSCRIAAYDHVLNVAWQGRQLPNLRKMWVKRRGQTGRLLFGPFMPYAGFHKWRVIGKILRKWMMNRGNPILGNLHILQNHTPCVI